MSPIADLHTRSGTFLTLLAAVLLHISPLLAGNPASGTKARAVIPLEKWKFTEEPLSSGSSTAPLGAPPENATWKEVTIPHVFRQSGLPDNAAGWYRLEFTPGEEDKGRSFYLVLEGAATVKDVYVNGKSVGHHKGAYTASAFDLTPAVNVGKANCVDLRVSNRDEESQNCLSRSGLYFVNGGLYRKAWLVKTGAVHIFPDMGSSGIYLTPTNITEEKAELGIRTVVHNSLKSTAAVRLSHSVMDPSGTVCLWFETSASVPAGETVTLSGTGTVQNPKLWDLGKPNLYTVRTDLWVGDQLSDTVTERTGFRTIQLKDKRFFLNGQEVQFHGVNKHPQNEYDWNAISSEELELEWQMMDEMGANAVRLPHYPHSHLEYDQADQRGMAVWAENGYAGQFWKGPGTEEKEVSPDSERLTREMVRQNWNHPSILFWSCGNETIVETASHYAQVIKEEDSTRLVTYAAPNEKEPSNCDFVAHNTYDGWYGSGPYTKFIQLPLNQFVSETGCGDWITHHVPYGTVQWSVDKFEPEEYAEMFAEYRLQTVLKTDVANRRLFFWWVFREFYDKKFKQNRNTKGLLTLAGMPKDTYYLFQAFMKKDVPMVHLCGRHHFLRRFAPDNGIKVYSNAENVRLTLNGIVVGEQANGNYQLPNAEQKDAKGVVTPIKGIPVANVFFWKNPLVPGRNEIEVSDERGHTDEMVIYQTAPDGTVPAPSASCLVQELKSSNPLNPAIFIDRPVESQGPVYTDIDGSSDNTFDIIPKELEEASWIATRRLSDPNLQTELSFVLKKEATVSVLFSTGSYPTVTLKKPDPALVQAAVDLSKDLKAANFKETGERVVWRDHELNRADAALWSHKFKAGERISIPGHTLDYVILVNEETE